MKTLPDNVVRYGRTPVYTQDTIPQNYRRGHTTKKGVWATVHVVSGKLRYRVLGDTPEEYILGPDTPPAVVAPNELHDVEALGNVEFYLEFYKPPDQ